MALAAAMAALAAAGPAAQGVAGGAQAPAQPVADAPAPAGEAPAPGGQAPAPAQPQAPVAPTVTTAPPVPPDPSARVFASPAGLLLNAISADATEDFEMVLARVAQALRTSTDPVRRQQAEGWRFFRATEPGPGGSVIYVFVIDPVVPDADYGVARLLAETFPDEAGALYELYSGAYTVDGQTLLSLQPVALPAAPVVGPGLGRPAGDAPLVDPQILRPGEDAPVVDPQIQR
jgi:hypothetical protein